MVLPKPVIFFYHSFRFSWRLGIVGAMLHTLTNSTHKIRLGKEAGWTIPQSLLERSSVCYCIGCGDDISFDLALIAEYSCSVFAFDPTPKAIAHVQKHAAHLPNYHFSTFAIWDKEETVRFYVPGEALGVSHSITNLDGTAEFIEVPAKRLSQVVRANGHRKLALLKMDIEGAEHTVIRTILEDNLQVEVLCVEFDELAKHGTPERLRKINDTIQSLLNFGYEYFWIEGPNFTFVRRATST